MSIVSVIGVGAVINGFKNMQKMGSGKPESALVISPLGYSRFVEYGTRHQQAQPFMRPAARRVNAEAIAIAMKSKNRGELIKTLAERVREYAMRLAPVDTSTMRRGITIDWGK